MKKLFSCFILFILALCCFASGFCTSSSPASIWTSEKQHEFKLDFFAGRNNFIYEFPQDFFLGADVSFSTKFFSAGLNINYNINDSFIDKVYTLEVDAAYGFEHFAAGIGLSGSIDWQNDNVVFNDLFIDLASALFFSQYTRDSGSVDLALNPALMYFNDNFIFEVSVSDILKKDEDISYIKQIWQRFNWGLFYHTNRFRERGRQSSVVFSLVLELQNSGSDERTFNAGFDFSLRFTRAADVDIFTGLELHFIDPYSSIQTFGLGINIRNFSLNAFCNIPFESYRTADFTNMNIRVCARTLI